MEWMQRAMSGLCARHAQCACAQNKKYEVASTPSVTFSSVGFQRFRQYSIWDSIYRLYLLYSKLTYGQTGRQESMPGSHIYVSAHWPKSNQNFRDITRNVEENKILHKIFRVVSRFPATFRVLSLKIDYLGDSVLSCKGEEYLFTGQDINLSPGLYNRVMQKYFTQTNNEPFYPWERTGGTPAGTCTTTRGGPCTLNTACIQPGTQREFTWT